MDVIPCIRSIAPTSNQLSPEPKVTEPNSPFMMQCVVRGELYTGSTYIMSVKDATEQCHDYPQVFAVDNQTTKIPLNVNGVSKNRKGLTYYHNLFLSIINHYLLLTTKLKSIVSLTILDCKFHVLFFVFFVTLLGVM